MKEKHLKILGGIFIFLLIVYFITKPHTGGINIDDLVQNIIIGISKKDIKTIEIYKETDSDKPLKMAFHQDKNQWRILTRLNCKAKNNKIDQLLDNLLNMTGKVRSSDPNHHDKYKITELQGIHLLLKDETGKVLTNLIIGKKPEDANSTFLRFSGNEKVYFGDKGILSDIGIYSDFDTLTSFKQDNFIDLQAVDTDKNDLDLIGLVSGNRQRIIKKIEREVEVTKDDSTTTTEKKQVWVLSENKKEIDLDQKKIDNFFKTITQIRAQKLVDKISNSFADLNKPAQYGLKHSKHILIFKKKDSPQQQNIIFGKQYEKDKGYYMLVEYDKGLVYKVSKSKYEKIFEWIDKISEITSN